MYKHITQQQRDYIIAHINDRPRGKVAEDAGVSESTLYRIVKENGGEMRYDLSNKNQYAEEMTRKHFATMTTRDIAERFGILRGSVNKIARRLGLTHNDEVRERLRVGKKEHMTAIREIAASRECQEQRRARWKRTWRMENFRVLSGMPQKTNFRMKSMPHKAYKAKWYICKRYGYIESTSPYVILYDGSTRRREKTENSYKDKYKFEFTGI